MAESAYERTLIDVVAGRRSSGELVFEELLVDRIEGATYRVVESPGFIGGTASGDIVEYDQESKEISVLKRGGNLCVQVYGEHQVTEQFLDSIRQMGGTMDRHVAQNSAYTIPVAATFREVERVFNELVKRNPAAEWSYANVYDPNDEATPLNWWT